jgi:hypothetical protein
VAFRDKRRDTDVLFDPPFDWTPPSERRGGGVDGE